MAGSGQHNLKKKNTDIRGRNADLEDDSSPIMQTPLEQQPASSSAINIPDASASYGSHSDQKYLQQKMSQNHSQKEHPSSSISKHEVSTQVMEKKRTN